MSVRKSIQDVTDRIAARSAQSRRDYLGRIEGQNGELLFSPETGHVIVVLANLDAPVAKNVSRFIAARLPGPEYGIPHVQLSANKNELTHEN